MHLIGKSSLAIAPYHEGKAEQPTVIPKDNLAIRMQEAVKTWRQSIVDFSLKTQFQDYNYFHQYGMGDIVALVGTSTAGKSSIIEALIKLEPDRLEDGVDLRMDSLLLKDLKKLCPNEIAIIENVMEGPLPAAVNDFQRCWKSGVSSEEKVEAEKAIERINKRLDSRTLEEKEALDAAFQTWELEMLDDAFERSRKGGNVIFDVLNIDALAHHVLLRNFNGPLRAVLTYCPFHVLSSRMEKRNKEAVESGNLSNQRIGVGPLNQFADIYSQIEPGQKALERLTREQVTKTFEENFDKAIEFDLARFEENFDKDIAFKLNSGDELPSEEELLNQKKEGATALLKDFLKIKKEDSKDFLEKLGFKEGVDVIEIAPKDQDFYHTTIDSDALKARESAELIHKGTFVRGGK